MEKKNCGCLTGHRKMLPDITDSIRKRLICTIERLYVEGITTYYAGGAVGFDALASEAVIERRTELSNLRLVVVVPHDEQSKLWNAEDQARYENIKENADEVISLAPHYYRGCMQRRNRYMVEHSSVCVCYLTEPNGGTAYTVNYAQKHGLQIYNLVKGDSASST